MQRSGGYLEVDCLRKRTYVTGDVAVSGASAYVGAQFGAMGGPLGVAAGALLGAGAGILTTTFLSDFKFMDVDNDGEQDSIGDAIKKGAKSLIDEVGSWFK